jgi:methyl-accepting chemotaxis protein
MKIVRRVVAALAAFGAVLASAAVSSPEALQNLQLGNVRFATGKSVHPNLTAERRAEVAKGQNPFATILTCSDSRVPAEAIFDQGLGDLFVVRVAGNVAKTDEIGSIEYGAGHLGTPLLVVMGHSSCGAVKAVLEGAEVHGNIPKLVDTIVPAVEKAKIDHPGLPGAQLLAKAVEANVWRAIDNTFENSAIIRDLVKAGKLKVVGAVYDLASGSVQWHGEHPEQARLLAYTSGASHANHVTNAHGTADAAVHSSASNHATAGSPHAAVTHEAHATSLSYLTIGIGAFVLCVLLAGAYRYSRMGMQRWTVNARLTTGFGCVLTALAGLAVESYTSLHTALRDFTEYRTDARHTNVAAEIQIHYLEMRIAAKDLVIFRTKEAAQRYDVHKAKLMGSLKEAVAVIHEPEYLQKLRTIETDVNLHAAQHAELQKAVFAAKSAAATEINQRMGVLGSTIERETTELEAAFLAQQNRDGPRLAAELQHTQSTVIWVGLAAIVLGVGLALIVARSITGVLQQIANSLNSGSEQTAAAAGQVSSSAQALSEGASEQAASLEETSASLEEITSMTKSNASSAAKAKELSSETRVAADTGASDMDQMKSAMDAIKLSSGEIAKIVKTIDEIAFQTNILALNAAVEAARAGEAGMGFAVVADGVRALAQRSAQAAKETAAKIEDSVSKSEHGVRISGKVAGSLQQIVERARKVDTLVAEIANASNEQSQGISQVALAITEMDKVTQSNAATAEESAAAAEELNAQSAELGRIVTDLGALVGAINRSSAPSAAAGTRPTSPHATPTSRRAPAKSAIPARLQKRFSSSAAVAVVKRARESSDDDSSRKPEFVDS